MRTIRVLLVAALVGGLAALPTAPANASFHLIKITEVFVGPAGNPDAQYVELTMYSPGQTQLNGAEVDFFGPDGSLTGTATFASNPPVGTDQSTILVATTEAATLFDVGADLVMEPLMTGEGGRVCFANSIDCVSWASSPVANTFTAGDTGIPAGATIVRDISAGDPTALEGSDDTNDNAADFDLGLPAPSNNAGVEGIPTMGLVTFSDTFPISVPEDATVGIQVDRSGSGTQCVDYLTADGTATTADYLPVDQEVCFAEGETSKVLEVTALADDVEEPNETVLLRLRNPGGGMVLGYANQTVTIEGTGEPEPEPTLTSTIETPAHQTIYNSDTFASFFGTAGHVDAVQVALQAKMTNGTCRWFDFTEEAFEKGRCRRKRFSTVTGVGPIDTWGFPRDFTLRRSKGTRFKHYVAFSRAVIADQKETTFEAGRNANRFEMR